MDSSFGWWGLAFILRERRLDRERAAERAALWTPAQHDTYQAELERQQFFAQRRRQERCAGFWQRYLKFFLWTSGIVYVLDKLS